MSKLVEAFFDEVADTYVHEYSPKIDELLDLLDLTNKSRILDLGAGKGIISSCLYMRSKAEIVALDISDKMCEAAKKNSNNPHIHIVKGDFYQFNDEPFDAIICFDAYPHFLDPDGFMNKCAALLNKGGLLAILHDIGRGTLNEHHRKNAGTVSRKLSSPKEESTRFLKYFKPLLLEEDEDSYKIILEKII